MKKQVRYKQRDELSSRPDYFSRKPSSDLETRSLGRVQESGFSPFWGAKVRMLVITREAIRGVSHRSRVSCHRSLELEWFFPHWQLPTCWILEKTRALPGISWYSLGWSASIHLLNIVSSQVWSGKSSKRYRESRVAVKEIAHSLRRRWMKVMDK